MLNTKKIDTRFRNLFKNGKLVHIHVRKWPMCTSVQPEDLGLEATADKPATKVPEFISLGRKKLFTDDVRLAFGRIENGARKFLQSNSHDFPLVDAHFVPCKILPRVMAALDKYHDDYEAAVVKFLANYEGHKQKMFEAYPDYKTILEPYYPTVEAIRPKYSFTIRSFEVAFPSKVKDVTMTDVLAQNIAAEAASKKYEQQMREQYEQQMKQMEEFVQTSALALRNKIVETFEIIAQKIKGKEVVTAVNLKTLKNVIDSFDALDFLDDEKVKEQLKTVKALVESGSDFKDDATALQHLEAAITSTLATAKDMSDVDSITGGYIRRLDMGEL